MKFTLIHLLYLGCSLSLLVHTLGNIFNNVSSDQTTFTEEDVTLSSVPFPVVFKIYVLPAFNMAALIEAGYDDDIYTYYEGIDSEKNQKFIGWKGQQENGTVSGKK